MAYAARRTMLSTGSRRGLRGSNLRRPFLSNNSSLYDRLVSYWRLDEASGAVRVDDFGGNNLANNNNVSQVAGKVGNASQFVSASEQSLSLASNASLQTGDIDFTFAGWVYLDSLTTHRLILSKYNGAGAASFEYWLLYNQTPNRFQFGVSDTGDGSDVTSVNADTLGAPSTATWYFVQAWHDAGSNVIQIRVNNAGADSAAHTGGVFAGTNVFRVGSDGPQTGFMNGRLDAWGFWKRLLTTAELNFLYNGGNGLELFPWGADRP